MNELKSCVVQSGQNRKTTVSNKSEIIDLIITGKMKEIRLFLLIELKFKKNQSIFTEIQMVKAIYPAQGVRIKKTTMAMRLQM